jgi:hypothetical protein
MRQRQTMNRKSLTSILVLTILFALTSPSRVSAQNKFHYLSIEFYNSYNDSINYTINISGLDSILTEKIKLHTSKIIKFKTENELFNAIGRLGWELYLIEDSPNKITQIRRDYNGQPTGDYNLYRDGIFSKRKVYFKLKE